MNSEEIVDLLLSKEIEITNKFHNAVSEILRLGHDTERGKEQIPDLIKSVRSSLDEINRIINK